MTAFEALGVFRASAPVRRLHQGGVEWQYRAAGSGALGLLLLPGAVGDGDAYFTLAPLLSPTHTLIAIKYPNVDSLADLLDGLRSILDREGLDSTDSVGGSFGGLIAQAFLQRFPQRTRRVVLSAAGPAKAERAASNQRFARIGARDRLKALYPDARVHTFPGAGHAISAERRHEWAATIAAFLTEPSALA